MLCSPYHTAPRHLSSSCCHCSLPLLGLLTLCACSVPCHFRALPVASLSLSHCERRRDCHTNMASAHRRPLPQVYRCNQLFQSCTHTLRGRGTYSIALHRHSHTPVTFPPELMCFSPWNISIYTVQSTVPPPTHTYLPHYWYHCERIPLVDLWDRQFRLGVLCLMASPCNWHPQTPGRPVRPVFVGVCNGDMAGVDCNEGCVQGPLYLQA